MVITEKSYELHHIVPAVIKGGSPAESRICPRPTVALKPLQTQTRPTVFFAAPPVGTKEVDASPGQR